jgi:hypothetical protein
MQCTNTVSWQGEEREVKLLKKKAREIHLELLLFSYLSPATATVAVLSLIPFDACSLPPPKSTSLDGKISVFGKSPCSAMAC